MEEIYKNLSLENLEGEIWLPIEGYENYQVSNMGRLKSLNYNRTKQEKILCQRIFKNGYLFVKLCKEGKIKTCSVHRLVANAFIPNTNNYPTVNHNNEIKTDNRVSNLCWMDYSQQQRHGTAQQRRVAHTDYKVRTAHTDYKAIVAKKDWKAVAEKLTNRQDQSKQVYQYTLNGELVGIFESTQECGRNGYKQSNVSTCCRNCYLREGNNVYKGYLWSYTEIN